MRHLGVELVGVERHAAGAAEHVLRQHVERADAQRRRVLRILGDRIDRGAAFQHLEAVGRHQHAACDGSSMRWLARPMRCSSREAPFGAPTLMTRSTSPQSMPRSSDEVATTARSRPAAIASSTVRRCADVERAVMQRDREIVVVDAPELLEDHLGLAARVDEDQRHLVALDQLVDLAERVARRVAGPGQLLGGVEHGDVGRGAAARRARDRPAPSPPRLRHQIAAQIVRLGDGRREADGGQAAARW